MYYKEKEMQNIIEDKDRISEKIGEFQKKYNQKKPFNIVCDKYISENSDDHKFPRGAIYDSSVNLKFNKKIHELLNFLKSFFSD